ncbi:superinfection immunity protein [Acidithiobacillus sp. M4-SHS-6]|uniref:superinfection immunity protein n=1 Tax=Acidithiobacillus sp. M4-SHS-6 TaxID=3383024 RepID=UPI0039BE0662
MARWFLYTPSGFVLLLILACLVGLVVYLLPVLLAWSLGHPHLVGATLLDVFLGWTVMGWLAVLIWVLMFGRDVK